MTYNLIYASCKGQKEDRPYQDYIKVSDTDKYLLAALADGLGSSKQSSRGACLICEILSELFSKYSPEETTVTDILQTSIEEWYNRLSQKDVDYEECLTTSSVLFIDKLSNKATFAHIGDSLIAFREDDGLVVSISEEKDFLNETECIGTTKYPKYKINEIIINSTLDFIIASDGFGDELITEKTDQLFNYFIVKYSRTSPDKRNKILKQELSAVMNDKNKDDKSIIFGWIQ